jgi:predicted enzyme related to lactoylglutathione lyase
MTAWAIFPASTKYFRDSKAPFMVNYIVDDLDATLEALRTEGVAVDERVERYSYGNFGWITDPDGNRIELWSRKPCLKLSLARRLLYNSFHPSI